MSEPVVSLRDGETLADYAIRVTRALDQQRDEARAEIARLTRERDEARAALDGADCTRREGGDTRHCRIDHKCLRCERDALRAALEAERAAHQATLTRLRRLMPMDCPECGPMVFIDEDGCCATCGADAIDSTKGQA